MKTDTNTLTPAADAIAVLTAQGAAISKSAITITGKEPVILAPAGWAPVPLEPVKLDPLPDHIRQAVEVNTAESFIDYVKLFKKGNTRLLCSPVDIRSNIPVTVTGLIDYHSPGKDQKAERVAHTVKLPMARSLELEQWIAINGKGLRQMEFVDFIDRNTPDISTPAAADLMELGMNFEMRREASFQSRIDRTTGGLKLNWSETSDMQRSEGGAGAGQLVVPKGLTLSLPIFEAGKKFTVTARLEYRVESGKLTIAIHLERLQDVIRAAAKELAEEITVGTDISMIYGRLLA